LSTVRILPKVADQAKKSTPKGTLFRQIHLNKILVPLKRAIRGLKMNCHRSIPKANNAIQLWKCCLKEPFPTPHVMPKTNLGAITHLESRKSRELSSSPSELLETHPTRVKTQRPH
jgi:hypothetical protein